ncbi:hypothetical protein SAMN05421640_1804 [Ekhidna lutea]|uniref:DUF3299 domain-containing protein n=1 Tax=Ekhidna lutea TaxID=447679 RepID=A0A239ITF5_EKHLU|nr:hypothetical protein [Ekhidna lutea]SNS96498.1 hypothetical protein SAMN05421640_1804 [Ekhidna lutea]
MLAIFLSLLFIPQLSGWELLSSVEIVMGYDDFMSAEVEQPKFSEQLKLREGKELTLEGFIIPLQQESDQDYFVLSRFPYQSCFFCGAAGPETVVEVYSDRQFRFTDERVRVTGKLRLNDDNPLHLFYILEDCQVTKLD